MAVITHDAILHKISWLLQTSHQPNLAFVKHHLTKSSRGASYEQACTKSQFLTPDLNCPWLILVFLMRWPRVPDLGCYDMETARTKMHSPSMWHSHVVIVSGVKLGTKGYGDGPLRRLLDLVMCHKRVPHLPLSAVDSLFVVIVMVMMNPPASACVDKQKGRIYAYIYSPKISPSKLFIG